ncbi:MAG: hypothetical protein JWQ48_205 [Conexibacter sp.]|nr:hypothetical protein [Conexibacter sp.]
MLRAFVSQHVRLVRAERAAAYWETQAVLRVSTVANELALRIKEAETEQHRVRTRLRALLAIEHDDVTVLRRRLAQIADPDANA